MRLRLRDEPLVIHRPAETGGALRVFDAAELPDGRLLVALGELGAWLLSREGKTLTRFSEPAEHIVMSDHGDRAIVVAPREETLRLTRIDLARRRQQPWCDVEAGVFAPDFDGSVWYVARGDTVFAVDATAGGWEHLWHVQEAGTRVLSVARDASMVSIFFRGDDQASERVWTYELPSHTLRRRESLRTIEEEPSWSRAALSPKGTAVTRARSGNVLHVRTGNVAATIGLPAEWEHRTTITDDWIVTCSRTEEGAHARLFDMWGKQERARVALDGVGNRARARLGQRLLVFDERGRLLVISLEAGSVLREITLT